MALTIATTPYRYPGARESDAHHQLGLTPTLFWAHVNALLDDPAALAEYPVQVRRLQRLRDLRRRQRANARMPA